MFDLCKKVEIYNIENHYYYIGGHSPNSEELAKINPSLIKSGIVSMISGRNGLRKKHAKKGIRLSKTLNDSVDTIMSNHPTINQQPCFIKSKQKQVIQSQLLNYSPCLQRRNRISWAETAPVSQNQHLLASLYITNNLSEKRNSMQSKNDFGRIQKIQAKSKPVSPLFYHTENGYDSVKIQIAHREFSSQHDMNKNLSETKPPVSSKIETSYTNDIYSSDKLNPRCDTLNERSVGQSMQYSSQKIISISKSVSSMHQQLKQSNRAKNTESVLDDKFRNSSNEVSVNLSNIFSKEQNLQSDRKKQSRDSILKKLSLWQDSDRHTIESRFSRQLDITQDFEVKIQQSFIYQHDLKSNFKILQQNRITKKDYIVSQAVQKNINWAVSLKQFIVHDIKLIVQQLQTYQIIQNGFSEKQQSHNILELYQVQFSENQYILIKQPYTMTMQNKLKTLNQIQQASLRQKAKDIMIVLMSFLSGYGYHPIRKVTTHQFVICVEQPKLHDLSLFKQTKEPQLSKQQILDGLDI